MSSFRHILSLVAVCCTVNGLAQTQPIQNPQIIQPQFKQPVSQTAPMQQGVIKQQPIQQQPIQTPPLTVVQNGITVFQRDPNQAAGQPSNMQPVRVAAANLPYQTGQQQSAGQSIQLYNPGLNTAPSAAVLPQQQQQIEPQRVHVGHSEPASRIIPFFLSPEEQRELDEFLSRWEKYSATVKRYDVDFDMFIYDFAIPGAEPNKAYKIAYGYFKYVANPMRFAYHVEGEWQGEKQIKRDGDKNPNIFAEKTIIDEKSVYRYDYNSKTVVQINVPPEMIGRGIADSPLPLIFGAKADELKRRFSMKIDPISEKDTRIWLQARPLLIEDQQEFKQIDILLDKKTLQAQGLRQWDINEKAYKVFGLKSPKVNDRMTAVLDDLKKWFTPEIERGWKHEVTNWVQPQQAKMQPQIANPAPNRNEIPLYQGQ